MKYDEEKGESEENEMKDSCWLRCREEGGGGWSLSRPSSGVIGSWTANLSQLNQQQQR